MVNEDEYIWLALALLDGSQFPEIGTINPSPFPKIPAPSPVTSLVLPLFVGFLVLLLMLLMLTLLLLR